MSKENRQLKDQKDLSKFKLLFCCSNSERSGEDWCEGGRCDTPGEVHHQHAEGTVRGKREYYTKYKVNDKTHSELD